MDDSCGKCSAPLGQRARVCLQCGATRVPSVAVDAVQDAPIEVGGTVEEIETTSPVEAALPVTPSEERAEPSPLKVEASVGPETIATEAFSVEVANSPDHAQDEIPAPSGNEDFIFPGLIEILQEHIAVQVSYPKEEPLFDIDVDAPPTEMSKNTSMWVVVNKWAFDNVDTAGSAILMTFESGGPAYRKFYESDFHQLFFVEDSVDDFGNFKNCYIDFGTDSRAAAIFISRLIVDFYGYDKSSAIKFEKIDWPDYGLNSQGTFEAVSVEVASSPHQEPRSGVPVSLVVILVLITALFASIFAFAWNSNPAGAGDAEGVSMYVSGRANARDRPSAKGSSIMGTYDVGTLLSGTWVNGVTDANERWLKFEADGQTRYIWDGNLSAEALSSSASSLSAAPSPPSLVTYLGKYPYEKVSGVSFWEHPAVVAQVEKLISSRAARGIILGGGVETPIAEAGARGEYLFAHACEQHNCGSHNWSVAITRDGSNALVCYYNADGGPIASANYDDTTEYTEVYEGCQLGD